MVSDPVASSLCTWGFNVLTTLFPLKVLNQLRNRYRSQGPHHKLVAWRSSVLLRLPHGQQFREHLLASASKQRRQRRLGHNLQSLSQSETSVFLLRVGRSTECQISLLNISEGRTFLFYMHRKG